MQNIEGKLWLSLTFIVSECRFVPFTNKTLYGVVESGAGKLG
jgi:hypothetical protein